MLTKQMSALITILMIISIQISELKGATISGHTSIKILSVVLVIELFVVAIASIKNKIGK